MGGAEGHGLSRAESHADALQDAIVYGSKARGDWNDDSDRDVLVIAADGSAEHYKALSNLGYDLRSPPTRCQRQVADIGAGHRLVGG